MAAAAMVAEARVVAAARAAVAPAEEAMVSEARAVAARAAEGEEVAAVEVTMEDWVEERGAAVKEEENVGGEGRREVARAVATGETEETGALARRGASGVAMAVAAMAADRLEEMGATADREVVEALEALGEVKVVEEMEMAMAVQMEGAMAAGTVEAVMVVVMVAEVCQAM